MKKQSQHVWFRNQIKIMFDKIEWRLWKFMTILPARAHRDRQKAGPDHAIIYGPQMIIVYERLTEYAPGEFANRRRPKYVEYVNYVSAD